MNHDTLIDIVIITWNSLPYLRFCIQSIRKYTELPYRLIIVDNGSTDGTGKYIEKLNEIKKCITNHENLGYPHAIQQGFNQTNSEFVCLMNDDIVVSPNWLSGLVKVMQNHSDLGILGPVRPGAHFKHPYTQDLSKSYLEKSKVRHKTPQTQLNFFTQNKPLGIFAKDYKVANGSSLTTYDDLPHIVSTCCALVRRSAVEKAGGLVDSQFEKYGADDTDLCWRLLKSKYKLGITAGVYIHHFEHISADRNELDRYAYLKQNSTKLHTKWKDEINKYLLKQSQVGKTKEEILNESWLLKRLYEAVGEEFWSVI